MAPIGRNEYRMLIFFTTKVLFIHQKLIRRVRYDIDDGI